MSTPTQQRPFGSTQDTERDAVESAILSSASQEWHRSIESIQRLAQEGTLAPHYHVAAQVAKDAGQSDATMYAISGLTPPQRAAFFQVLAAVAKTTVEQGQQQGQQLSQFVCQSAQRTAEVAQQQKNQSSSRLG